MALKPLSPASSKPSASGKKASPIQNAPKPPKGGGNMSAAVIVTIVIAAIIGIFVFINKSNTEQQNAVARQAAENKKIEAENKARAEEHKRQQAEAKAAKQAKMEAAAREAEEAAARKAQEQQAADEQPSEATEEPAEDETPAETTEEPAEDTEEPADSEEDAGADEEEPDAGSAEGELTISPEADKDPANAKRLLAMARKAGESGEYADFAAQLKEKLEASYPSAMKTEAGQLPKAISKAKTGETARCIYLSVSLALESAEGATEEEQKDFMKWLLAAKQKPAVAFGKSLTGFKITEHADALDMMEQLRDTYKEEPKRAFAKIKSITNPLAHNVSKKLYPNSKKDIAATITKLKNVRQRGTTDKDQQDAVNLVNVYRYLCGLPANVVYDSTYHKEATEAAQACKNAGHIAHDLGHHTNQCNLFAGISGPPTQTVSGYMSDNGGNNREARGHRAWILYAGTGKTAFGKVDSYQAMRTLDGSNKVQPKTSWSYPGRGFFPVDYLHGTGWSYYCAPGVSITEEKEVKVEMWSVPKGLKNKPSDSRLNKGSAIPILNVFPHKGGASPTGNTIVFEPDYTKMKQVKGKLSGTYWIRISWPGFKDEYVVEFY